MLSRSHLSCRRCDRKDTFLNLFGKRGRKCENVGKSRSRLHDSCRSYVRGFVTRMKLNKSSQQVLVACSATLLTILGW